MSTQVDELLDTLAEGSSENPEIPTAGHIVIDRQRFITVPEELKRIAVQGDHNVETTTFDCPRFWDTTDLSLHDIYVNYTRADGTPGQTKCTNVVVDETDENLMHFDWTVKRHSTLIPGELEILICATSIDDSGFEETHWNSELCNDLYISPGKEVRQEMEEVYPDVLEDMEVRIQEVEAIAAEVKEYNDRLDAAATDADDARTTAEDAKAIAEDAKTLIETANINASNALAVAQGRNRAHVFATTEDMQTFLADPTNMNKYIVGDNLYIADEEVPDWWIAEVLEEADPETGYFYKISQLETQKIDLTEIYAQIDELRALIAAKNDIYSGTSFVAPVDWKHNDLFVVYE